VVVVGGIAAYHYGKRWIVMSYSDTAPLEVGATEVDASALGELHGKIANFGHALRNKTPVEPLVLSGEELNELVASSEEFRKLGGRARFTVGEGQIQGELSIPLERFGYPDRWFNGSAIFKITLENGVLVATIDSATVKGNPVPEPFLVELRKKNLASELYQSPQNAALIARLESVEIHDGRITIVPRIKIAR